MAVHDPALTSSSSCLAPLPLRRVHSPRRRGWAIVVISVTLGVVCGGLHRVQHIE
jgi:hypothetical protein